ncbi:MAG: YciI family protein [Anaerolineae bacterium]
MKYICLIYTPEVDPATVTKEAGEAEMAEYMAFGQAIAEAGVATGLGDALYPTAMATTVRVREGKAMTSDGPFAETKEQLGGFYILDCKDIDEALKYAAMIPGAKHGSIEVRPLMVFD